MCVYRSIVIDVYRVERAAVDAVTARCASGIIYVCNKWGGCQYVDPGLLQAYEKYTAISATIADEITGIVSVYQAVFIALS